MTKPLVILPAVDVMNGKSIRLTTSGESEHGPALDAALAWQEQGAQWIHLVDLDAAFGTGHNRQTLEDVIGSLDVPVQLSGGITDEASLDWAISTGAERINLGASVLRDLTWPQKVIERFGPRIAISLDVRGDRVVARGSGIDAGSLQTVLQSLGDVSTLVVTDSERDGSLLGINMDLLAQVVQSTTANVIASGGLATLEEIDQLRVNGVDGAIIGKALYAGVFTLCQALERAVR